MVRNFVWKRPESFHVYSFAYEHVIGVAFGFRIETGSRGRDSVFTYEIPRPGTFEHLQGFRVRGQIEVASQDVWILKLAYERQYLLGLCQTLIAISLPLPVPEPVEVYDRQRSFPRLKGYELDIARMPADIPWRIVFAILMYEHFPFFKDTYSPADE